MRARSKRVSIAAGIGLVAAFVVLPNPSAEAEDFFSMMFRAFGGHRAPARSGPFSMMTYGDEPMVQGPPRAGSGRGGSGLAAYCVRTCDGRYFPAPPAGNQMSRAETCNSFCPAAETRVFYGSSIEEASTESGQDYADLPNAYRYRSELVKGCSCNGTDPVGLAKVDLKDDKTLRQGDFVAAADGLKVVTGRPERRGSELSLAPAPRSVHSRFKRNAALE